VADMIIKGGINSSQLKLEDLPLDRFISSQQGSFNHRHSGLSYRIKRAEKMGRLVPPKRFADEKSLTFDFKLVQYIRLIVRKKSLEIWENIVNAGLFDKKMKKYLRLLNVSTLIYHYKKAVIKKLSINSKL